MGKTDGVVIWQAGMIRLSKMTLKGGGEDPATAGARPGCHRKQTQVHVSTYGVHGAGLSPCLDSAKLKCPSTPGPLSGSLHSFLPRTLLQSAPLESEARGLSS